jgi:enoyl-[acyl-carrier protein] reductase I
VAQVGPFVELRGKRRLVIGIANEHSIAVRCADVFARAGARRAATYLNPKAEPFVRVVTDKVGC